MAKAASSDELPAAFEKIFSLPAMSSPHWLCSRSSTRQKPSELSTRKPAVD
jgi:hypothetical protein